MRTLKNIDLLAFFAGGIIFLGFFYWAYSGINSDFYQVRDDGVITMSHAKNLVDYGFIGVSPSGERIEGYSAPVQFFIYASAYALTGVSYDLYASIQTLICTFLLGGLFTRFFKENITLSLLITTISAFILSKHTAFLQWHGSGMENPITHVLFLSTVLILYSFSQKEKIFYPFAFIVFLATISRVDSVYHIAPLLVIFSIFWLFTFKNLRGLYFSVIVFFLWLSYHLWRYFYFGDILPNTAYAQSISVGDRIRDFINFTPSYIKISLKLSNKIFSDHGGYLLLISAPFLYFTRKDKSSFLLFSLITSIAITSFLNPFLFGQTRLDPVRSTTQLALFSILGVAIIFSLFENKKHLTLSIPMAMLFGTFSFYINEVKPYDMCCRVQDFDSFRKKLEKASNDEDIPRPTISNPDLGVMSWHKQFNIVDLGMLGSKIMARVPSNSPILSNYFFDYAAPDMIESHYAWTCRYKKSIFNDSRFRELYKPIRESVSKDRGCGKLLEGIWIRKDIVKSANTPERILVDDLKESLSIERLQSELENCQKSLNRSCVYVARTAYRFLPEFKSKNNIRQLNSIFSRSRTKDYDLYLINGYKDNKYDKTAIKQIISDFTINQEISNNSKFNLYYRKNNIIYSKKGCNKKDIKERFFLHIIPEDKGSLPSNTKHNFVNMDFSFNNKGIIVDDQCFATINLPSFKIKRINTGQFVPQKGSIWEVSIDSTQLNANGEGIK